MVKIFFASSFHDLASGIGAYLQVENAMSKLSTNIIRMREKLKLKEDSR